MDFLLYHLVRALIAFLQTLPLRWVARIGRVGGAMFYIFDARHRKVAQKNLSLCFSAEKTAAEIRALSLENFKRIGENFTCAIKTSSMKENEIENILERTGLEKLRLNTAEEKKESRIFAIGHFGNFELLARCFVFVPGYKFATTYRGLRQPSLNRLLRSLREKSGCLFFERRAEADALKVALNQGSLFLGLFADQNTGDKGLRLPFFGHLAATGAAPAIFALRYQCPLFISICYRTDLGKWRVEVEDEIPTRENGQARSTAEIMLDVNRVFEKAIRRDPANWFWVHNRWKIRSENGK